MRNFFLIISIVAGTFLLSPVPVWAQQAVTVKVVADSLEITSGMLYVALYGNEAGFKNGNFLQRGKAVVQNNKASVTFSVKPGKEYCVALFQDLNDNGQLDTKGTMKIPNEPFGFSNNKQGKLGPPKFEKIAFIPESDTVIYIYVISSKKAYLKKVKQQ